MPIWHWEEKWVERTLCMRMVMLLMWIYLRRLTTLISSSSWAMGRPIWHGEERRLSRTCTVHANDYVDDVNIFETIGDDINNKNVKTLCQILIFHRFLRLKISALISKTALVF